jgi:uncharacterized protein (TIGR00297 family)
MQLPLGLILAALIGFVGYRRQALSRSGVVGAIITGGLIFGFGGLPGAALLLAFFISSSALSRFKESQKASLAEKFFKGSQRDLGQALANGGLAAVCALAWGLTGWPGWWAGMAAALAAANADTWATELGVLNRTAPRLITTGQAVETGASGGVSASGTLAAGAGAALIGLVALLASWLDPGLAGLRASGLALLLLISLSGLAASLFDSLLGATAQAIYRCDACGKETERHPLHRCGAATRRVRGWPWLNNDWVNFLATAAGAGLGLSGWWGLALLAAAR